MKQIILGTAGHIDHGKTTLIKALTGTDTDRLKEEKQRGITIELGFASLDLPGGQSLGIVDVPGHEKFVKNMVAGVSGIDLVAMVIAADEGVMPQTREHMEICTLLGIRHGLVVLTKTDMVDEEWLELVQEDVADFTRGTFLEEKPVVPVSAVSGEGLDTFVDTLARISRDVPQRSATSLFRLPADRVFSMKGFGTVITGTLISGRVRVGETIQIYPSGITSKVRGVQVHNQSVEEAAAGLRTAINFQGLERSAVQRGDVVSRPGALRPSYMQDVWLHFLASNPKAVKNRTRVRFHAGTNEIMGLLILLDREELAPGEDAAVQIRLDSPAALVRDDRFVLRSYSPVRTIGGGQIINPIPEKHKRFRTAINDGLKGLVDCGPAEVIDFHALMAGFEGVKFDDLKLMTNLPDKALDSTLKDLLSRRALVLLDRENRVFLHHRNFEELKTSVTRQLEGYHQEHPLKGGMPKEELRSKLPGAPGPRLFNLVLNHLTRAETLVLEAEAVRLSGHKVSLAADEADVRRRLLKTYQQGGLMPPYFKEVVQSLQLDGSQGRNVLEHLVREGSLIKVKEDLFFDSQAIRELRRRLVEFLDKQDEIDTPRFKEMTGASRKYVIPLIEYFDATQVTLRIGDIRKLRKGLRGGPQ